MEIQILQLFQIRILINMQKQHFTTFNPYFSYYSSLYRPEHIYYPIPIMGSPLGNFYNSMPNRKPQNGVKMQNSPTEYIPKAKEEENAIVAQQEHKETIQTEKTKKGEKNTEKSDRNIQSNALKLFLKCLRNQRKTNNNLVSQALQKLKLPYTAAQFYEDLDHYFQPNLNYIRPFIIKSLIIKEKNNFTLVLTVCVKEFFSYRIHLMTNRPVRTSRQVRREQIRAGRKLLEFLL